MNLFLNRSSMSHLPYGPHNERKSELGGIAFHVSLVSWLIDQCYHPQSFRQLVELLAQAVEQDRQILDCEHSVSLFIRDICGRCVVGVVVDVHCYLTHSLSCWTFSTGFGEV